MFSIGFRVPNTNLKIARLHRSQFLRNLIKRTNGCFPRLNKYFVMTKNGMELLLGEKNSVDFSKYRGINFYFITNRYRS